MILSDLTLQDLDLSEEVFNIFSVEGINSVRDVLRALELYKFLTREEIVAIINAKFPDIDCVTVDYSDVKKAIQYSSIEEQYNVIIHEIDGKNIIVYSSVFNKVAEESLSLELAYHNITYKNVTDLNFDELCDKLDRKSEYRPSILFKRFLLEALRKQATDLHFTVEHSDLKVRYPVKYRKDGNLYEMNLFELDADLNKSIILSLIEHRTQSVSLDVSLSSGVVASSADIFNNGKVELRISAHRVKDGYRCVIRIQEKRTVSFKIPDLGFPDSVQKDLYYLSNKRSGITLITGAIRTGKNTTAYAMANEMVKYPINLISYDSPIEVLMPFAQVDYKDNTDELINYVRLAKKQDIDVAYLNEIPTKEVAFAIQDLVNSSVYVITTLHLDRIWHLPYRLKEYYGDSYKDIITQINGVINQKMFPVLCPHCSKATLSTMDRKHIDFLTKWNVEKIYVARGCPFCKDEDTGHYGTIIGRNQPIVEHIVFTEDLKEQLIQCKEPYDMEQVLKRVVRDQKRQSLEHYMADAIRQGTLSTDALDYIL